MEKPLKLSIWDARRLLGNPYAYSEVIEGRSPKKIGRAASSAQVRSSRAILQEPYAHLDDEGGFSALSPEVHESRRNWRSSQVKAGTRLKGYSEVEIEKRARELQINLWRRQANSASSAQTNPLAMLDLADAARFIGFEYREETGLGQFLSNGQLVEVAGLIDQDKRTILVSRQLPLVAQRFTAAHEIGHALLHADQVRLHRDRPVDGPGGSRDLIEREADKFASYFLMPSKLVRKRFLAVYRSECFVLDEESAFNLGVGTLDAARRQFATPRLLARHLSSAQRYAGTHITSMADQFGVSVEAMAIRLQELALVGGN